MAESFLAWAGAISGLVAVILGVRSIMRNRPAQMEHERLDEVRLEHFRELRDVYIEMAEMPETHNNPAVAKEVQEFLAVLNQTIAELESRTEFVHALRDVTRPRTVEVQKLDGSTVEFGVDPTDAASVTDFLDDVRRARGERVLAIH